MFLSSQNIKPTVTCVCEGLSECSKLLITSKWNLAIIGMLMKSVALIMYFHVLIGKKNTSRMQANWEITTYRIIHVKCIHFYYLFLTTAVCMVFRHKYWSVGNIGILGVPVYQLSKDSFGPSCFSALLLSSRPFNHRFHANKPNFEEGERTSGEHQGKRTWEQS